MQFAVIDIELSKGTITYFFLFILLYFILVSKFFLFEFVQQLKNQSLFFFMSIACEKTAKMS